MQAKVLPMKFLDGQLTMKTLKIISPQKFVCIQYMYVIYYVCMYVCICMYAVYVKTVVLTGKIGIYRFLVFGFIGFCQGLFINRFLSGTIYK